MGWNGLDLLNDFAAELGDTSNGFKTKVLRWINEGIKDIGSSHEWPQLREKGKAVLVADQDIHPLPLAKPAAPTVALLAGGALTLVSHKVLVTFYESQSGVESVGGFESAALTPSGGNLSIALTAIPLSTSPLVTHRRIYVSVNGAAFQYHGEIADNATLVYNVTSSPTSQVISPDESAIFKLDGDLFIEGTRVLRGSTVQNITFLTDGVSSTGSPESWAPVNEEEVMVYPMPSSDTIVSFWYFKRPARIFGTIDSVPQLPGWLYEDLRRYVIWRGYEFRDRAGKESKQANYENGLRLTISRRGKPLKRSGRVRSVTPDSDGYVS